MSELRKLILKSKKSTPLILKAEMNRTINDPVYSDYGTFKVHNKRFNQMITNMEKINKHYEDIIKEPTEKQKEYNQVLKDALSSMRYEVLETHINKTFGQEPDALAILSFRDWCGAGTNVWANIRDEKDKVHKYSIDNICKQHDLAYEKAESWRDQAKADIIFISEIFRKYIYNPVPYEEIKGVYDYITYIIYESGKAWANMKITKKTIETLVSGASAILTSGTRTADRRKYLSRYHSLSRYAWLNKVIHVAGSQIAGFFPSQRKADISTNSIIKELAINAGQIAEIAVFTTFIYDKLMAFGSILAMTVKLMAESVGLTNLFFKDGIVVPLVEHELTKEQENEMINTFNTIQNEILKMSNITPIDYKKLDPEYIPGEELVIDPSYNSKILEKLDKSEIMELDTSINKEDEEETKDKGITESTFSYLNTLKEIQQPYTSQDEKKDEPLEYEEKREYMKNLDYKINEIEPDTFTPETEMDDYEENNENIEELIKHLKE